MVLLMHYDNSLIHHPLREMFSKILSLRDFQQEVKEIIQKLSHHLITIMQSCMWRSFFRRITLF